MVIQHNMQAMNTNRQLGISVSAAAKSTEKLSSGYRINRAGDDAAGLAISEKMRSQIRGLDRASANSQDGISLIQTAEGALNETQSILQRMRELSVQAANGTNTDSDRNEIQKEVNQLTSEINRIANTTEFNTMKLLKGNTNKAEIGGVDTETLVDGETGVTQGAIDNFRVDKNSKEAVNSTATLTGNTAEATGGFTNVELDEDEVGIQGEYSTVRVGGLQFSSKDKDTTLNGKKISIVAIADDDGAGNIYNEGMVEHNNTIYVAIKKSTIDSLINAEELIRTIQNFDSGNNGTAGTDSTTDALIAAGVLAAGTTGTDSDLDTAGIKISFPEGIPTADDLRNQLPSAIGDATKKTGELVGGRAETIGKYNFNLDNAFDEAGDSITVAGETFTTVVPGDDVSATKIPHAKPDAKEVSIGSSSAAITLKLDGKVGAGSSIKIGATTVNLAANDNAKTIYEKVKADADVAKDYNIYFSEETGYMTIAKKQDASGGGATVATKTAFAAATFDVDITDAAGGTLAVNGTAVGAATSNNKATGGIDLNAATFTGATDAQKEMLKKTAQAQNLALAMNANANLSKSYVVKLDGLSDTTTVATLIAGTDKLNNIVIEEKLNQGGVANMADSKLDRTLSVAGSGGEDDTITITNPAGMNGIEFELNTNYATTAGNKADGTAVTGTAPTNGVVITQDAANKNKFHIYLGTTANSNKASKIQEALRKFTEATEATLEDGTKLNFKDFEVTSSGKWDETTTNTSNTAHKWTATAGGVEEQKGTYSFDVTKGFGDGDEIIVAGKKFIAKTTGADISKGEIDISSTDKSIQARNLKDVLDADSDINSKYDVTVSNMKVILTEKKASGEDMKAEDVSVQATGTKGQFKVDDLELQKDGASITIDGQKIDFTSKNAHVGYENGTAIKVTDTVEDQKTALAAAINKNAELSKKYEASIGEDGSLMLTQKVGSDNAPEITTTSSTKGTFDVTFQVGANTGQSMTIAIGDNRANALGVAGDGTEESIMADNGATAYYTKVSNVTDGTTNDNIEFALDVTSFEKATAAIGVIDDALTSISAQRSQLGAYQNRLEHTIANLDNTSENLQSSESRIRDVDMAKEMTNFSKNNILQQAAQSMLAQANQSTQGVLTLLR